MPKDKSDETEDKEEQADRPADLSIDTSRNRDDDPKMVSALERAFIRGAETVHSMVEESRKRADEQWKEVKELLSLKEQEPERVEAPPPVQPVTKEQLEQQNEDSQDSSNGFVPTVTPVNKPKHSRWW